MYTKQLLFATFCDTNAGISDIQTDVNTNGRMDRQTEIEVEIVIQICLYDKIKGESLLIWLDRSAVITDFVW